jgi:pilus assembly protein Flp/PilA
MLTHLFMSAKAFLGSLGVTDEEGQGLIEYALIVLLISIAVIAVLGLLSGQIQGVFQSIGNTLESAQPTD